MDGLCVLRTCLMKVCMVHASGSGHRMFLINTKELAPAGAPEGRAQEFAVLGATGNGRAELSAPPCAPKQYHF